MDNSIKVSGIWKQYVLGELKSTRTYEMLQNMLRSVTGRQQEDLSNSFWALQDINFTLDRGRVLGLIGRNGSGKSTLLKLLARITNPTRGSIEYYGRMGALLEVGTGFHPELTGRENIYLNGAILGMNKSEISTKFDEIVEFSEISQFLDTPVKHYSSGMYVRLAFSVAAHLEPEILLLDEVLAVGDLAFQHKSLRKMHEVVKNGRTVIFVSHSMDAIRDLCDRVMVLDHGKMITDAPAEEAIKIYEKLNEEQKAVV